MSVLSINSGNNTKVESEYLSIGDGCNDDDLWNKLPAGDKEEDLYAAPSTNAYEEPVAVDKEGDDEPGWLYDVIDRNTAVLHVHDPEMGGGLPGSFLFRKRKKEGTFAITLLLEPGMITHYLLRNTQRGWILNDDEEMPIIGPKAGLREIHEMLSDPRGRWKLNLKFGVSHTGCHDRESDMQNLLNGDDASAL